MPSEPALRLFIAVTILPELALPGCRPVSFCDASVRNVAQAHQDTVAALQALAAPRVQFTAKKLCDLVCSLSLLSHSCPWAMGRIYANLGMGTMYRDARALFYSMGPEL